MICPKCGKQIEDDAVFCTYCGNRVAEIQDEEKSVKPKNIVKHTKIFAIVGLLLIVILTCAFILSKNSSGAKETDADILAQANFQNGGILAYDSDRLYFVGYYNSSDDNTCLYSTKYDETDKMLLAEDGDIKKIRICGGKIYYEKYTDSQYELGVMDKTGENKNVLATFQNETNTYVSDFDADKNNFYYCKDKVVYKHSLEDNTEEELLSGVQWFVLSGGKMLYIADNTVYSYNLKTKESTQLKSLEEYATFYNIIYDSGKLYFSNKTGIYEVPLEGDKSANQLVKDTRVQSFIIKNNEVYYIVRFSSEECVSAAKQLAGSDTSSVMAYSMALMISGNLNCVSIETGESRRVQSDQVAYGEIFAYPDGLYNQLTIFVDTLTKFEEKQKTSSSTNGASNTTDNTARDSSKQNTSVPQEYQNALTKGLSYARNLHMSKKGVYDQLTSSYGEGFSADAAQYAIDNMTDVDWNANALEKAKQYYYNMSMSKSAVYDQLTSEYGEQFTASQAQYAIDHLD